jgi:hypothetical protein
LTRTTCISGSFFILLMSKAHLPTYNDLGFRGRA